MIGNKKELSLADKIIKDSRREDAMSKFMMCLIIVGTLLETALLITLLFYYFGVIK
jgi:hypothetical protein